LGVIAPVERIELPSSTNFKVVAWKLDTSSWTSELDSLNTAYLILFTFSFKDFTIFSGDM
jgi:hypothetical protein